METPLSVLAAAALIGTVESDITHYTNIFPEFFLIVAVAHEEYVDDDDKDDEYSNQR